MATRKRGMKSIPNALSQANSVFPIVPIRARGSVIDFAAAAVGNEREVLDLDLQFEDNEVFDVWSIDVQAEWDLAEAPADTDLVAYVALFEDPDIALLTDLTLEATFEDNSSLIDFSKYGIRQNIGTDVGQDVATTVEHRYFVFPQPYTVARNLALLFGGSGTEGAASVFIAHVSLWGRRRNASDAEFKNIIYRQRF